MVSDKASVELMGKEPFTATAIALAQPVQFAICGRLVQPENSVVLPKTKLASLHSFADWFPRTDPLPFERIMDAREKGV